LTIFDQLTTDVFIATEQSFIYKSDKASLIAHKEKEAVKRVAKRMLADDRPIDKICKYTGLNKEDFTE
jgi:hypothetical protein